MNDNNYNIHSIRLTKKDGKLVHVINADKSIYQEFVKSLTEGQFVDLTYEAHDGSGTNDQLKKIHACIREISMEMGDSFKASKRMIKELSGFWIELPNNEAYEKSFADCSVQELSIVIQAIIECGDDLGINFRGSFPSYRSSEIQEDPSF